MSIKLLEDNSVHCMLPPSNANRRILYWLWYCHLAPSPKFFYQIWYILYTGIL